jgi:hypothetical protein
MWLDMTPRQAAPVIPATLPPEEWETRALKAACLSQFGGTGC